MSPTDGSTSRGTATSMMNSGSRRRRPVTASTCARVRIGRCDPVAVMTMSAAAERGRQLAPTAPRVRRPSAASASACAAVRLVMTISPTPCARRCCAVSVLISPAPTTSTRRPSSRPKILRASATAAKLTETAPFAERRLGAHALADAERPVKQLAQQRPGAVPLGRGLERVLHLAEDLRLADDQRVEAGRDAEQVPRRLGVVVARRGAAGTPRAAAGGSGSGSRRAPRARAPGRSLAT